MNLAIYEPWPKPTIPGQEDCSIYAGAFASGLAHFYWWTVQRHRTLSTLSLALELEQREDWEFQSDQEMGRAADDDFDYDAEEHDAQAGRELARAYVMHLCDTGVTRDELASMLRSEMAARGITP